MSSSNCRTAIIVSAAVAMIAVRQFEDDMAVDYAFEVMLQMLDLFLDQLPDGVAGRSVLKGDPERRVHAVPPSSPCPFEQERARTAASCRAQGAVLAGRP